MGAAFLAEAWVEMRDDKLALWEGAGADARALDGELEFPVVATVPPGRYQTAHGADEAEVEVVATSGRTVDFDELGWEADPQGKGLVVSSDGHAGGELATALGGAVTTRPAPARLIVSLGPSLDGVRAQAKVALGEGRGAHYAVAGEPVALSKQLADALAADKESA
jgi:hypothetical protein